MPSIRILDLNVEILADIFQIVNDESPRTTSAIAQVNKTFNFAVELVRYRRETLKWSSGLVKFVDDFDRPVELLSPDRLRGLRHLTISKGDFPFEDIHDGPATTHLIELLDATSNLKSLTYKTGNYPPSDLIRAIQKRHPRTDLKVYIDAEEASQICESQSLCLAQSRVTEFTMEIPKTYLGRDNRHQEFEHMISTAKHLRSASLTSFNIHTSRMRKWQAGTDSTSGRKRNTSLRQFCLDGWPVSADTLEYWSQFIDLSRLETLSCTRGPLHTSYFIKAAEILRNLKSVSLNLSPFTCSDETANAVEQYIGTCPPLTTLSLWSWMGKVRLETILSHHGPTLQDLQLHVREEEIMPDGQPQPLPIEKLKAIRMSCPKLSRFTFDVKRVSKYLAWNEYKEIFDEVKLFNLNYLQVYMDCGLMYMVNRVRTHNDEEDEEDDPDVDDYDEDMNGLGDDDPSPDGCGGLMDSESLETMDPSAEFDVYDHISSLHPPVSTKRIPPFVHQVWKHVFGDRITGDGVLDVKFGEWERKVAVGAFRYDGEPQKDLRVWCHAEPHPRDDKKGQSEVVLKCCQGLHLAKCSTG
ncbi:hypothetical protein H2204_014194 [Knufia peltigerae]|uniref:Uncharacterized protein n=1 Tax=Knufia peltigerae TaxID=1002370 RepID=A0AA38XM56_9EURO|nr:hypothetical protein H2204_014194 [Knufia peltigerae]